jgi:hypothetical protein
MASTTSHPGVSRKEEHVGTVAFSDAKVKFGDLPEMI